MDTPKKIEIELSDSAAAVLTEMARRGKVKPAAIGRVCLENTLAQAIDRGINDDGDSWIIADARNPKKVCRKYWDIKNPGSYELVMGANRGRAPLIKARHYLRTGNLGEMICDRFVNVPDHNEEHTQAQVNELYNITIQILGDNPLTFRTTLLKTLPRYEVHRGQRHRHSWEKKMMAWEKTLTKKEDEARRDGITLCWWSVSRGAKDDMRRAKVRLEERGKS